jgi:CRISPR type II-A-associated protein Csn2
MKLIHNLMEKQILFDYESTNTLIVESPIAMRMLISDLKGQIAGEPGRFVYSKDDFTEIDLGKECELIMDPFVDSSENRRFSTKLNQSIKQIANNEEFIEVTASIESELLRFASRLVQEIDESVLFNERIDSGLLIKLFSYMFDFSDPDPIDNLITFIKALNKYLCKTLFIFVNVKSFLNNDQLIYLSDTIHGMKCDYLLIENTNRKPFIDNEKCCIIDKDLCEIFSEG